MKKIDTFLFDLDGTLIDTNDIIIKSYQHTFNTHFKSLSITKDSIIDQIGPPLSEIFARYTQDQNLIKTMIDTYRSYYKIHEMKSHKLYPGVKEVLSTLKEKGYKLGIVTSKFKESAMPSFTYYGLEDYFDVFIALDDVEHPKPSGEPVLKALEHFNNSSRAIMIGDNQSDILSGQNAGILSAGVSWSIKGKEHLSAVNPDIMFDSMYDIIELIKEWEDV